MYFLLLATVCLLATVVNAAVVTKEFQVANISSSTGCTISSYVLALQHACGFESIHGLWPDPETSCSTCTAEVFSTSKLSSSTLSGMKKYWPTCIAGNTNEDFWSHEWSKHGTCSGMTQDGFFSKTLSLFSTYGGKCSTDCHLCFTPSLSYVGPC